jgi:hypothetical protein
MRGATVCSDWAARSATSGTVARLGRRCQKATGAASPERSVLYGIVREHLDSFLKQGADPDGGRLTTARGGRVVVLFQTEVWTKALRAHRPPVSARRREASGGEQREG